MGKGKKCWKAVFLLYLDCLQACQRQISPYKIAYKCVYFRSQGSKLTFLPLANFCWWTKFLLAKIDAH